METVKDRLIQFIDFKGESKNHFEEKCGLSKRYVSNISVSIQPDKIKKISLAYPELNTGWLLTGEGKMLLGPYDRINMVLKEHGLSQKEFAKGASDISFLLPKMYENASKKNPGDIKIAEQWVDSLLKLFPKYNKRWLLYGEGEPIIQELSPTIDDSIWKEQRGQIFERIKTILVNESCTPQQFGEMYSTVPNIYEYARDYATRKNTLEWIACIIDNYPQYSFDWIYRGIGSMKSGGSSLEERLSNLEKLVKTLKP